MKIDNDLLPLNIFTKNLYPKCLIEPKIRLCIYTDIIIRLRLALLNIS